ncbi:MAG TPA: CHAD domain-containing protein [Alphaproteobacteria bacterium]|nr:CHAD domain-containing protein [Alphaproteobacteria bacterium]
MPRDSEPTSGPIRAQHPQLSTAATVGQSFAALSEAGVRHLARNVEAFLARPEPDPVHQARVAVRRLRALLSAYRPVLPKGERKRVAADLKRLQKALGPARDLDVFLDEVLPALTTDGARSVLAGAAQVPHRRAYLQVRKAMAGPLVERIAENMPKLAETLRLTKDGKGPARELGRTLLARRHRNLAKRLVGSGRRSGKELHALRIRIKKLRYAVEFFRPVMEKGGVKAYHAALAEAQDVLGRFNDAVNARALAAALAKGADTLDVEHRHALDTVFRKAEDAARKRGRREFAALRPKLATPPRRWFR